MSLNNTHILCTALGLLSASVAANTPEPQPVPGANPYAQMLPVLTQGMSPGRLNNDAKAPANARLPTALFIVGDDALSHRWLNRHQGRLKQMSAMGMIVNVEDEAGLNRFKAYPLTLYPVRGDEFIQLFNLTRYPVLINTDGTLSQ